MLFIGGEMGMTIIARFVVIDDAIRRAPRRQRAHTRMGSMLRFFDSTAAKISAILTQNTAD
jgi:hypothetical protein